QGDEHEDGGRDGRDETCGEERDAGLVAQGGKVVDTGEPDDEIPGLRVFLSGVRGVDGAGAAQPSAPTGQGEGWGLFGRRLGDGRRVHGLVRISQSKMPN